MLFAYTSYRAFVLSITWDEAFSYLEYIRNGIYVERKFGEMSANNHFLNTWLCIFLVKIVSVSEFVLRIPSLLAHILFLFCSGKLVLRFSNTWLIIGSFLLLNCNPYLLDFFSLSRGYALSVSLMLLSIFYLVKYLSEEYKIKHAVFSLIIAALAVLANLVLINYFVVLFSFFSFFIGINFIKVKEQRLKRALHFIVLENIVFLFLALIVPTILKLRIAGAFFYGADHSFWSDTVSTSVISCLYGLNYGHWVVVLLKIILLSTLAISVGYLLISFRRKEIKQETKIVFSLLFIIGITAIAFIIQHHFLHTLYLIDRTTQFYIVLFNLLLVYIVNGLFKNKKVAIIVNSFLLILTLIHFGRSFNFSYVWEWKSNACVKQMVEDLEKHKKTPSEKSMISVGVPLDFEMGLNYYHVVKNLQWLNVPDRTEPTNKLQDYWFLNQDSLKTISKKRYKTIATYDLVKSAFVQPEKKPVFSKIICKNTLDYSFSSKGTFNLKPEIEYSPQAEIELKDSIIENKNIMAISTYTIKMPYEDLYNSSLIIALEGKNGLVLWKQMYIKEYIRNKKGRNEISFSCILPKEIKAGNILKSYIWNKSTKNIFIEKAELKLLGYIE